MVGQATNTNRPNPQHHGPVVAGKTLEAASYATEELEATAKLALLLRGADPRILTADQVTELEKVFGRP